MQLNFGKIMQTKEIVFENMLRVLDTLIENAEKLKDLSAISEDSVESLQQKQEKLIDELCKLDTHVKTAKTKNEKKEDELLQGVQKKLSQFQSLNTIFVDHLKHKLGLIYFSPPNKKE